MQPQGDLRHEGRLIGVLDLATFKTICGRLEALGFSRLSGFDRVCCDAKGS